MSRRSESLGIWLSHGPIDAITTYLVYYHLGRYGESNPIIYELLEYSPLAAIAAICLLSGLAAILWTPAADAINAPAALAHLIILVGLVVGLGNLGLMVILL
jgi:hypothetical protein